VRLFSSIRRVRVGLVVLGAIALGLALVPGCGDDKGGPSAPPITTVPAEWGGLWTMTVTTKFCPPSGQVISTETEVDTICAGKSVEQEFEFSGSGCSGGTITATATSVSFSCSDATATIEGCNGTVTVNMNATINTSAGTISGTGQITFHPTSGTNCPPSDICIDITIAGTRTSTAQPGCGTSKPGMFGKLVPRLESVLSQGGC